MCARRYHLVVVLLLAVMGLSGCLLTVPSDPASPYSRLTAGTELRINEPLTVPIGSTRIFFQNGEIVRGINRFASNCNLEVRKIDHERIQGVDPGEYRVTRVQQTVEEIVRLNDLAGAQLAAAGGLLLAGYDGGVSMIYLGYHLWLEGPDPNVMRLSCRGSFDDPALALPPSVNEIRASLGDLVAVNEVN